MEVLYSYGMQLTSTVVLVILLGREVKERVI